MIHIQDIMVNRADKYVILRIEPKMFTYIHIYAKLHTMVHITIVRPNLRYFRSKLSSPCPIVSDILSERKTNRFYLKT